MTNKYYVNPDLIKCKSCDYTSENKIDFDEEGLCRNCENGKLDAIRGDLNG